MNTSKRQFQDRKIELFNKLSLNYTKFGSSKKRAVIFIHGYADSWHSFERLFNIFTDRYTCYGIDLRGHGDSSKPECCYKLDDFVNDIYLFQEYMGIRSSTIIGHSLGSFIGQAFAATYPERTDKLILISSSYTTKESKILAEIREEIDKLEDPVSESFIRDFQTPSLPVPQDFLERIISESKKIPSRIWKIVFNDLLSIDNDKILKKIRGETLILWGSKDVVFGRAEQTQLISNIKNSHFIEYDAGHALHWEIPELAVKDMERFLR